MRRAALVATIIAAAIAVATGALAQDSATHARYEAALDAAMAKYPLKAVLIGISESGEDPWLAARGETMTGVPATPDMHFRSGAVAITYLGVLLLRLAEQGVVALDDPVAKWFPDYPNADSVTLEMLIHNTSGYADYVTNDEFLKALHTDPFRAWTQEELVAIGLGDPVHCEPGKCWSYAHTNFVILGNALAKAAGKPLAELLTENITDPLGLTGTVSNQTAFIPEPVLHAFDRERGHYEESTYWDPSWTIAEGLVQTSTIADIIKSAIAVGEGTLLTPESQAIMLAPATAGLARWTEDNFYSYGVTVSRGWFVQVPSFSGYAATMAYLPSRKLAIAISVTVDETADPDRNYSPDIFKDVAAEFVPEVPLQ
jgi:CubicO group peptidase (beta-lactamase class C family)